MTLRLETSLRPLAALATLAPLALLGACSFKASVGGSGAQTPANGAAATPAPTTAAAEPTPVTAGPIPSPEPKWDKRSKALGGGSVVAGKLAGRLGQPAGGSSSGGASSSGGSAEPGLASPLSAPSPFGSGTLDPEGFTGLVFFLPAGATKFPDPSSLQASASLWTRKIDVTPAQFATGFAGLGNRKENFAIRYEGPLEVKTGADYSMRLVADDGAVLAIDDLVIVDNDGTKTAPASKTGPVHLVPGTHLIRVDYFQTTGDVTLQLYCTKAGGAEKLCASPLD